MMKQCETCVFRDVGVLLTMCDANKARYHWQEFLKTLPFIGKYIDEYKCKAYEEGDAF